MLQRLEARAMIKMRRAQLSFGDGLIADEVKDLYEDWMKHVDEVLGDEALVATVYEALAKRRPNSRNRGRLATPAEVVVRLLVLKHVRNWSYGVLEREVRANLVYRNFTRVAPRRCPTPRLWDAGGARWGRERSSRSMNASFKLPTQRKWLKGVACASIRP